MKMYTISSLQAIFNRKYDHPILVQLLEVYMELTRDGRETVFIWVPGHVGIGGSSAADSAAKDAHDGDISDELTPFADGKSRMNKYLLVLWHESGTSSQRINCARYFHICRIVDVYISSDKQRRRICDMSIAHWSFLSYSLLFIEG